MLCFPTVPCIYSFLCNYPPYVNQKMKWKRDGNGLHGFTDVKKVEGKQINILMDGQADGQTDAWIDVLI